jgi:polyisoprenoid-binding protein YceI
MTTLALGLVASPVSAQLFDGDGTVEVAFSGDFVWVSDAPLEKIKGTAKGATGAVSMPADLAKTTGKISIPAGSMETGNSLRDKHLKGKEWLDSGAFPEIVFVLEGLEGVSVEQKGEVRVATAKARGTLTIHGKTKKITVPIVLKAKGKNVKAEIEIVVSLADFDIEGSRGTVGKKVGKTIVVNGTLRGTVK